jgi:hypothetical protein
MCDPPDGAIGNRGIEETVEPARHRHLNSRSGGCAAYITKAPTDRRSNKIRQLGSEAREAADPAALQ